MGNKQTRHISRQFPKPSDLMLGFLEEEAPVGVTVDDGETVKDLLQP